MTLRRLVAVAGGGAMMCAAGAASAADHPTNLPGVTTPDAPPAHFGAIDASEADLAAYGFPPRPDPVREPLAYTHWATAVGAEPHRLAAPHLQQTAIYHGPHIAAAPATAANATSSNWSGYAVDTGAAAWSTASFSTVAGNFMVPAPSTRSCDGVWEYSSVWIGIDGYASNDVLQAGVEADAYCLLAVGQTYYSAWYEWYPYSEVRITNLEASPGQAFYVHVWATSATAGQAYVQNLTTNTSVSLKFSAPSGTKLHGESAEWIVESPSVSGSLATLPSYGRDFFAGASAKTRGGTAAKPGTAGAIPISLVRSGVTYSTAGLLGPGGILFTSH